MPQTFLRSAIIFNLSTALAAIVFWSGDAHAVSGYSPRQLLAAAGLSSVIQIDNRLYRHCHNKGVRVVCLTADPWSPEAEELRRRRGAFDSDHQKHHEHDGRDMKEQRDWLWR